MKLRLGFGSCLFAILVSGLAGAQEPLSRGRSCDASRGGSFERDSFSSVPEWPSQNPFVGLPQLPKPSPPIHASGQQSEDAQREQKKLYRCKLFIRTAMQDHKHRIVLALHDRTRLEGYVVSASPRDFLLLEQASQREREIRYEDVAKWSVVRSPSERALIATKNTSLIILAIPLMPFLFLAWASGWDGC